MRVHPRIALVLLVMAIAAGCGGKGSDNAAATSPSNPTTTGAVTASSLPFTGDLDGCEALNRTAKVVFQPEQTMQVGHTYQVKVVASVDQQAPTIPGVTDTTIEQLVVHCSIQARLRGLAFTIDPDGFQVRSFLEQSTVTWSWDVEPKQAGALRLTLEVQSLAGGETSISDEFSSDILVQTTPSSFLTKVKDGLDGFVGEPIVQFLGFGGILAGVALVRRWLAKRKARAAGAPVPEES